SLGMFPTGDSHCRRPGITHRQTQRPGPCAGAVRARPQRRYLQRDKTRRTDARAQIGCPGINSLRARPESGRPRIRSPARKILRRYSSAVLPDASAVKYAAISNKSCSASGDQISARLSPGISPARPPDHVLYLEFPARAFVKRLNALGEIGAKAPKF